MESHHRIMGPSAMGNLFFVVVIISRHTHAVLPLHMGGESYVIPTTLDDRTVTFLNKANAMSPAGFKGHMQSVRTQVVPLHAHFDAEEGDDQPPPAHNGSDAIG